MKPIPAFVEVPTKFLMAHRLRELRQEKGLTLRELGKKAKMHYAYLSRVERRRQLVSIELANRILKALGLSKLK